jgi:Fe-S oxidoreductase
VLHSTELINDLLKLGKLHPSKKTDKTFIWHDPCYLGRHNGIYRMPRNILSLIPGITVIEADKSRDRSFCCGAGGGRFWMESSGQRINDVRVEQLLEKKTDAIATGCMYCLIMLEDGLESRQMKGQVLVKDIAEIAAEAL